jgi:hypothetical protein
VMEWRGLLNRIERRNIHITYRCFPQYCTLLLLADVPFQKQYLFIILFPIRRYTCNARTQRTQIRNIRKK